MRVPGSRCCRCPQHTGAEIHGVDLREPMDDATVRAIRTALLRWKVVFFRDQELTRDQHVAFGRRFGQVSPGHPTLTPRFPEHPEIVMIEKEHHRDNPRRQRDRAPLAQRLVVHGRAADGFDSSSGLRAAVRFRHRMDESRSGVRHALSPHP